MAIFLTAVITLIKAHSAPTWKSNFTTKYKYLSAGNLLYLLKMKIIFGKKKKKRHFTQLSFIDYLDTAWLVIFGLFNFYVFSSKAGCSLQWGESSQKTETHYELTCDINAISSHHFMEEYKRWNCSRVFPVACVYVPPCSGSTVERFQVCVDSRNQWEGSCLLRHRWLTAGG